MTKVPFLVSIAAKLKYRQVIIRYVKPLSCNRRLFASERIRVLRKSVSSIRPWGL